jgi:hypothetical protein
MQLDSLRPSRTRLRNTAAGLTKAKLVSILVVLVVPGGFLVPLCYGAYEAVRRAFAR